MESFALDFMWPTEDPFLFCAFHKDLFPKGNASLGPDASLQGRSIGQDFQLKDGYRMYHGQRVPGFPTHPHRGFETITVVEEGFVDHADSLGAAGRYGQGDVQWMTAGRGIQHSEMFPLLQRQANNPLELFQIWINLPASKKMVEPHFKMFWSESIPIVACDEQAGRVKVIAGQFADQKALTAPPDSWASSPASQVGVYLVDLKAGGQIRLEERPAGLRRRLYFFAGEQLHIDSQPLPSMHGCRLDHRSMVCENRSNQQTARFLVLEGQPISEPVFQHGPFVMNHRHEIVQAIEDYQQTQFGGWPWPVAEQVHGSEPKRFARYPDGRIEEP